MGKEKDDIVSDEDYSNAPEAEGEFMDGDFDDEAWDEADYADGEEPASDKKSKSRAKSKSGKKKSKLLPAIIVVAVAALAGLYFIGSGGQSSAPQPPAGTDTAAATAQDNSVYTELQKMQQPASEEMPVLPPEPPQQASKGKGFLNNPEKLSEVEQLYETMQFEETTVAAEPDGQQPPMPAPVQGGGAAPAPLTPLPSSETPPPMDITAEMPVIRNEGAKDNNGASPALLPKAQDIGLGQPSAAADKMTAELSQVNEMLGSLADRMGDLEDKVESIKNSSGGASSADLKEIKTALAKLEKRVDSMRGESPAPHSAITPPSSPREAAPEQTPVPAKTAAVPAAKGWILKAAQPGRAIVTKAGSDETYAVSVGDKLDGIGKISSVSQQDGKWVVTGAAGKIVQ